MLEWEKQNDVMAVEDKKNNYINLIINHAGISKKFVEEWIHSVKNCNSSKFFDKNALCTIMNNEYVGYDNMHNKLVYDYGIYKQEYNVKHINSQPHGNRNLYINIFGNANIQSTKSNFNVINKFFHIF